MASKHKGQSLPEEIKGEALEVFEHAADHYAIEREHLPYFRFQLAIVRSMLAGESGRILDIGCAAGAEISTLRHLGFRVVGVDFSPQMLSFAKRRFANDPDVNLCRADIEHLPFPEKSMDHVVCLGVFEFLPDYGPALREIHRVLRPGGLALFAIPSAVSLYMLTERAVDIWRAARRLLRRNPVTRAPLRRNLCVPWRYRALLRQHHLEPEHRAYSNFFLYFLDHFPDLNVRVTAALEPLCSVPLLRCAASVYMVSARKRPD
jgi:ubiquinone/menaquinone biosynthesis C-methylase UbiE